MSFMLTAAVVYMLVVPSRPQSASVTKVLPTTVDLYMQPPDEDGGMPVTHYVVYYENKSVDFPFGLFVLIDSALCKLYIEMC